MFYYKDYSSSTVSPKRAIDEIADALQWPLSNSLCVKSAELVEPEKLSGEGPIELQLNIDWRLGTPLVSEFVMPWKVADEERCRRFADEIVPQLGRDVECYTDRNDRASTPGRNTKLVYERSEHDENEMKKSLEISEELARKTAGDLADSYRSNATEICLNAASIAQGYLDLASSAMGETDDYVPWNNSVWVSLDEAQLCRAINGSPRLERAAHTLDHHKDAYELSLYGERVVVGHDALRAVTYVNEIADALHAAGRPAYWIPVHNPEVYDFMKMLGLIPEKPKFEKGDRVRFWDVRATSIHGRCANFPERFGVVEDVTPRPGGNPSKGRFWTYDVREGDVLHKGLTDWDIEWPYRC